MIQFQTNLSDHRSYFKKDVFEKMYCKVENVLKGSLDSILSPSSLEKIQIMGRKVCWRCYGKTLLGVVFKSFALLPQVSFPANDLKFH